MAVLSCGSSGSASVTATVAGPDMAVDASSALAARLTGSFRLHLELGQYASSKTDVSIGQGNLVLRDAASQASLVLLRFMTAPPAPYQLDPGGKLEITFTIADKAEYFGAAFDQRRGKRDLRRAGGRSDRGFHFRQQWIGFRQFDDVCDSLPLTGC